MNENQLNGIFKEMINQSKLMIGKNLRSYCFNEHFFHHLFSHILSYKYPKKDLWSEFKFRPEYPTKRNYKWEGFKLSNPDIIRENNIDRGQSGRFDFVILDDIPIFIEFKGPRMYSKIGIAKDMIKLLYEPDQESIKVFFALITSSETIPEEPHQKYLRERFEIGYKFALEVLKNDDISQNNIYAYIATIPDKGSVKYIRWGKLALEN